MLKKISLVVILLAVLILNILRFWRLDTIPYGYHVDEVGSAVTVQCMAEAGCDAELRPWPLFGSMEYGQDKPPTYIYPAFLWGRMFGTTVPSLRAYSVFVFLVGVVGLFFLSRILFGNAFAIVVVLAATCSPWGWVVNRVALESWAAVVLAIWGLYFFWRSSSWWNWAFAALLFSGAMYAYPPARMQIPLMLVTLGIYEYGRRPTRWSSIVSFVFVFVISLFPLVDQYLHQGLARRFNEISIFNKDYLQSLGVTGNPATYLSVFIHNYLLHLSPDFLFLTGDPSYVHSTRHLGLFSGLDIVGLAIFLVFVIVAILKGTLKGTGPRISGALSPSMSPSTSTNPLIKHWRWLIFLAANFFIGIIPSALTNQELPHALRICGSWPFMMLFTGTMCWMAIESFAWLWPVITLTGILCGGVLAYQYFTVYPQESKGMFDFWVMEKAQQLQTQEDWQQFLLVFHRRNYHCRYFMVHRLGMTCKQANDTWWQLYHSLIDKGMF